MSFVIWELTWNDNLPFLRYISPNRACIIATWLLITAFVIRKTSQSLHHCNMAVGYVFCDLGADVKRSSPVFKIHNPTRACTIATWLLITAFVIRKTSQSFASLQHGCWLCLLWFGSWRETIIFPFLRYITSPNRACIIATWLLITAFVIRKTSRSLHYCNMAVGYVFCDLGADVKRSSPVFKIHQPKQGLHHRNMAVDYGLCDQQNQPELASWQHGCWLCLLWFGSWRETIISRF